MPRNNWYYRCPYVTTPFCPSYYRNSFGKFDDFHEKPVFKKRAPLDVERTAALVENRLGNLFSEIHKTGLDARLLKYITKSIITYIDMNFEKFEGTVDEKVDAAMLSLQQHMPWIAEVMKIFNISQDTINKFINGLLRILFESLITQI